jgi:hypothetical protein
MSSIFIGERKDSDAPPADKVRVSVTRRFSRESLLRYQTFVYNASGGKDADVTVRLQILREGQSVLTPPPSKLLTGSTTDFSRLPFSGEVDLGELPAARYVLQITATDNKTGSTTSQQTDFTKLADSL